MGLEWAWTKTNVDPVSRLVSSAPAVMDVNGDRVPDVVFVTWGTVGGAVGYASQGRLRAVSGRDGSEIWSVTDPALGLNGNTKLAVADIDGDGRPEILAEAENRNTLLAFEHDGSFKWRSDVLADPIDWGGPAIADLDADGVPEIVIGRQVLTNQGHVRWTGLGPSRGGDHGANSIVVDLDLDGRPEVVAGNTAYVGQGPAQGQILWRNTTVIGGPAIFDGYAAAGNFDDDPNPEIVLVSRGWLLLLEHDGRVKWGPTYIDPSIPNLWAGPPTVADLDGDGALEIAVAGLRYFTVFETDGSVKWRAPIADTSTGTGSVAFDFDGDGAAELVYADQDDLRIFRGSDGVILFRDRTASSTGGESPVVADVDGDGEAEIVVVTDNWFDGFLIPGVRVYGEATGSWAEARPLWNQFAYSVSNVDDDGRIPLHENRNLALGHRWARASLKDGVPGCAFPQPDLTASALRITDTASEWELAVRIGNGGARVVGPDVAVSFYDGDPRLGAAKLGTAGHDPLPAPGRARGRDPAAAPLHDHARRGLRFGRRCRGPQGPDPGVGRAEQRRSTAAGRSWPRPACPTSAVVDVDVSGLVANPKTLVLSGVASARIRNQSDLPVAASLDVAFFEDRDGDGVLGAADAELGRVSVERARLARDAGCGGAGTRIAVVPRQPGAGLRRRRFGRRGIRRDEQRRRAPARRARCVPRDRPSRFGRSGRGRRLQCSRHPWWATSTPTESPTWCSSACEPPRPRPTASSVR